MHELTLSHVSKPEHTVVVGRGEGQEVYGAVVGGGLLGWGGGLNSTLLLKFDQTSLLCATMWPLRGAAFSRSCTFLNEKHTHTLAPPPCSLTHTHAHTKTRLHVKEAPRHCTGCLQDIMTVQAS